MATLVGIREFKRNAPRLVEKASRGERIIITRYGRPQAQLEPVRDEPIQSPGQRTLTWERERDAFDQRAPRLLRTHRGQYVAVHKGRVVDADADHEALYERVWSALGGQVFFIGRVGASPPLIDMPGFEIE